MCKIEKYQKLETYTVLASIQRKFVLLHIDIYFSRAVAMVSKVFVLPLLTWKWNVVRIISFIASKNEIRMDI